MTGSTHEADREVARLTRGLAEKLRAAWPADAMSEIDGDLEYGQFSEAVLVMVAVRRRDDLAWPPECRDCVDRLVDRLDIHREVARTLAHVDAAKGKARA